MAPPRASLGRFSPWASSGPISGKEATIASRRSTEATDRRQGEGGRGCVGEAGRRERDHPLDAGMDPHDGNPPEDLLGGDAHEGQGSAVKGMSRIDDLDHVIQRHS